MNTAIVRGRRRDGNGVLEKHYEHATDVNALAKLLAEWTLPEVLECINTLDYAQTVPGKKRLSFVKAMQFLGAEVTVEVCLKHDGESGEGKARGTVNKGFGS